jgi:hypothetical protein
MELGMNEKLTGRTRFRNHSRFGRSPLLVVQVEVDAVSAPHNPYDDPERYKKWRDARPEDLLIHPQDVTINAPAFVKTAEQDNGRGFPGTTF